MKNNILDFYFSRTISGLATRWDPEGPLGWKVSSSMESSSVKR